MFSAKGEIDFPCAFSNAIELPPRCCKKGFCDNKTPEGGTTARPPPPPRAAGCLEDLIKFPPIPRPFWARSAGSSVRVVVPGDPEAEPAVQQPRPRCVICMDRRPEVVLVPCGHQNVCAPCAHQWKEESGSCPTDRRKIDLIVTLIPL